MDGPAGGYREAAVGGTLLVARDADFDALRETVAAETLHAWAGRQPGARPLHGRGVAWATRLTSGTEVVVRHSRHGGLLAWLTGDLFLAPTRAPVELAAATRLATAGVPTPAVVAFAVYGMAGPLCRADVMTAHVDGTDFPSAWAAARGPAARNAIVDALAALFRRMQAAGAWHEDLNVKNVLISAEAGAPVAWLLDVDRVVFRTPGDHETGIRNARRFARSTAKWRARHGLDVSDANWARLLEAAGIAATAAGPIR
jgi:3-deoxy-D-manno-octulosonic acid kinase